MSAVLTKAHLMKIFTYENRQQFFNIYFLCEHYIRSDGGRKCFNKLTAFRQQIIVEKRDEHISIH